VKFCKFTKFGSEDVIYINPAIISSVRPRERMEGSQITLEGGEPLFVPEEAEDVVRMLDEALAG
jgi:pyruvate-formate lyase-activating enzyme